MTGWRVGYACGPREIITAMHKVQQSAIMSAPTPGQVAALEALTCAVDPAETITREFAARRDVLLHGLRTIGLPCVEPRGAIYAFPSVAHLGCSAQAFSERLLLEEKVAVVPGNAPLREGHVRIAYTLTTCSRSRAESIASCKRFRACLGALPHGMTVAASNMGSGCAPRRPDLDDLAIAQHAQLTACPTSVRSQ